MSLLRFFPHGALLLVLLLLVVPVTALAAPGPQDLLSPVRWDKVDQALQARLADAGDQASVELMLRLEPRAFLEDVRFRRAEVVERLRSAAASQATLRPQLETAGFTVKGSFWIANYLLVEGPAGRVGDLTRLPSVARVVPNFEVTLLDSAGTTAAEPAASPTWGLERIGADQVWSRLGIQGDGVRVCVSDTGVDIDHPDLTGRMATDNPGSPEYPGGWIEFDSSGNPVSGSTPHDTHGHGTHTSGTVLGGDVSGVAIGVAPAATLMHALVLPGGGGTFAQVIAGIEWCVDPTDDAGNPAGQPADVHSMSWGATGYYDDLVDPIRNSLLAGTLPVAAAGNCGEGCSGTPGNVYDALGIGASDESDAIAYFSSGEVVRKSSWSSPPADWPDEWTVPLLSAPGVNVYSSVPGGGYESWQGTSMATPHVAGCAALMLAANPSLGVGEIRDTLVATADWFDTYASSPPDTRYGWGRIDCLDAVESVAFDSGITGALTDEEDGAPVDQGWVNVTSAEVSREVRSDDAGGFRLSLKPGTYDVTVERFGYAPASRTNVSVDPDTWVTLDFALVPGPRGNVTGTAVHNATDIGLPGVTVTVLDVPVTLAGRSSSTGAYALSKVPEGTYRLQATSPYFRDGLVEGVVVVDGTNTIADFRLDPRDWVAVLGDHGAALSGVLRDHGYYVEAPTWTDVVNDAARYQAVVVNHPGYPGSATFDDFLAATDAAGTGVVFLDQWEHTYTGGGLYYLYYYLGDPSTRDYGYDSTAGYAYYNVTQNHTILEPYVVGDRVVLEDSTVYHMYAWFDGYAGANGTLLAEAGLDNRGDLGPGIAVDERANNRHVLLSLHGATNYGGPGDWTADGTQLFRNAVEWVLGPAPAALPVDYDLRVDPPVGLWYEAFRVTVDVKNVGNATGNYTARLRVDGGLEATQAVALASGEGTSLSFDVTRDPVGTYRVSVGPHAATFRVRPPAVTLRAEDAGSSPVADASVLVGLGSAVLDMGRTGADGTLTFDSPAGSHGTYWIVLRWTNATGIQHFLSEERYVDDDVALALWPDPSGTATLDVAMEAVVEGQEGYVYLRRDAMSPAFEDDFPHPVGSVVVTQANYSMWARTVGTTTGSTWSFDTVPRSADLHNDSHFDFGGVLEASLSWSQAGVRVSVDWAVGDGHGNLLRAVSQANVGALAAGETTAHTPLLSLWDENGTLLRAGYVEWGQSPAPTTLEEGDAVAFVQMDLETGPYPFANVFDLQAEVRDSRGPLAHPVAATADTAVTVTGTVLRGGDPVPAQVSVNDVSVPLDANGTFAHPLNLTEGFNNLTVTARDLAGNERSLALVVLSKPTVLLLLDPLPAVTNASPLTVAGLVEPGASLIVNGQKVTPDGDGRFAATVTLLEGENVVVVAAVDYLGTRREEVWSVTLDTVAPDIRLLTPVSGQRTLDETVAIVGDTEPGSAVTLNGEPVAVEDGSFAVQAPLAVGENAFELRAVDPAGNVAVRTFSVTREPAVLGVSLLPLLYIVPPLVAANAAFLLWLWKRSRDRPAPGGPGEDAAEGE